MISEEEALRTILEKVETLPPRLLPLARTVGTFVAEDVLASVALPPFDNSAMDGYAVVAASTAPGARLKVVGEQPAGVARGLQVVTGEAIRIFTGAPIPAGADAVIMQEEARIDGDIVTLEGAAEPGEFVRRRGGDVAEGQKILARGERVNPCTLALLAAQGIASLSVGGQARAAIISTGDELAEPGTPLEEGQIYDSNSMLLRGMLEQLGVEIISSVHCADETLPIQTSLAAALSCNVIIITGGVSVGARDFVKSALRDAGATVDLWRVALRPGKPFLFGRLEKCAVFGLPGNPVSAFVTFLLFVRPALLKLMGAAESLWSLEQVEATTSVAVENRGERPHYVRGRLRNGIFTPVGRQESHALFGLSRANALVRVSPGENISANAPITVHLWNGPSG